MNASLSINERQSCNSWTQASQFINESLLIHERKLLNSWKQTFQLMNARILSFELKNEMLEVNIRQSDRVTARAMTDTVKEKTAYRCFLSLIRNKGGDETTSANKTNRKSSTNLYKCSSSVFQWQYDSSLSHATHSEQYSSQNNQPTNVIYVTVTVLRC